jgi:hypothetical protein
MKCFVIYSCLCASILLTAGCGVASAPQSAQVDAGVPADTSATTAATEPKSAADADTATSQDANVIDNGSGNATTSESQPEPKAAENQTAESTDSQPASPKKEATASPEKETAAKRPAPKPGVVHSISFDDLNCGMQADVVFRPWMLTDRVKELDGQRVSIAGYMHPDAKQKGITEFILLRNTECKFGPAGQADHLIQVKLKPGVTTRFSISPVEVVGILKFNPFTGPDGNTWSIFDMDGESVGPPKRPVPKTSK